MRRVRVVLDTNILIAALITKGTPPDRLYRAWLRGEIELVTSAAQKQPRLPTGSRGELSKGLLRSMCAQLGIDLGEL
jgi:predicted nucleic acid-binding protein